MRGCHSFNTLAGSGRVSSEPYFPSRDPLGNPGDEPARPHMSPSQGRQEDDGLRSMALSIRMGPTGSAVVWDWGGVIERRRTEHGWTRTPGQDPGRA